MFSSQWWFMTTLMQELHMWGLGSNVISCRGSPHKKRNRSIFLSRHGFVLDDSSYFDDVFCFRHQKLNPKSSSVGKKGVRTSAGWGCSDIDDYTINKRLQTLQKWGLNSHTSDGDRVDPNILLSDLCVRECVSACVSARARFSTEAVRSVTDRGETQELSTFHSSSWGDWERAHESTNTVYPRKRRSCPPTNCLSRRRTATVERSGSVAATRRSCHD